MKKAKFIDNFKMVAGACIGHFSADNKQCSVCHISSICCKKSEEHSYPKNEKQVKTIINQFLSKIEQNNE